MSRKDESSFAEESRAIIDYRIGVIESTIQAAHNIADDKRAELLTMIAGLRSEIADLSQTHHEEAASITRFADASAHEAIRSEKKPRLAETALQGLQLSIEGLEESHPNVIAIVNRFSTALSNMGI